MNILVHGFYSKGNIGDDLFKDAFIKLFPEHTFVFTDYITTKSLEKISAIFVGGGSLLDSAPHIDADAYALLLTKSIFYIGVGVETDIHPKHQELMRRAKLIATRSEDFEHIKELNDNIIHIPDLVYCLENNSSIKRIDKTILYLPNIYTVPYHYSQHWEHLSWDFFKLEFSQAMDHLIDDGYKIDIFAMCKSKIMDDAWAGVEIQNKMVHRKNYEIPKVKNCLDLFSKYSLVITQRYHGIVLAELTNTPYISIFHHDKLKRASHNYGSFVSYFEVSKAKILEEIYNINQNSNKNISLFKDKYEELKHKVSVALSG